MFLIKMFLIKNVYSTAPFMHLMLDSENFGCVLANIYL